MAYELTWDTPTKVLHLKMFGDMPLEAFIEIDGHINECLQESDERIALIVDASDARVAPYGIDRIRSSQGYLQNHRVERLIVVSHNKLNRLAMMLLFNLCLPKLQFCDNFEQAQRFLEMSGSKNVVSPK